MFCLQSTVLLFICSTFSLIYALDDYFLWGAATAAYQIEGAVKEDGRGPSVWDSFSAIPGKISHGNTGEVADDSYHLYEQDISLLKQLGVNAYRFSISWSRILPHGIGKVNPLGIAHYNRLIDRLIEENIEPLVTLYHWDLPDALEKLDGGLLSPNFEQHFVEYADICFKEFGNRVKRWITINEPWTVAFMGYGAGVFAPGRCSDRSKCAEGDSSRESYIAAHNMLNAHAAAVELYRNKYQSNQKGVVGITVNQDWAEPLKQTPEDIAAAERRVEFQLGWFTDPIYFGDYPSSMKYLVGNRLPQFTEKEKRRIRGSIDFLGLNHYSTKYYFTRDKSKIISSSSNEKILYGINITSVEESMRFGGWADDQLNYETKYDVYGNLIGPQAQSPWLNLVPWGFYKTIMWVHERYLHSDFKDVPIVITENGCDAPHETEKPLAEALHDTFRLVITELFLFL